MKVSVMKYLNPDQRKQFYKQKKMHLPARASAALRNASFKNILTAIVSKMR